MARAPKDPNAPKRVVNRKPKTLRALLGVDEAGKPFIQTITADADAILAAVLDNPGLTLVKDVQISK